MPDFSKDNKFNKYANFESVKFGADAPLLETELNELQDIQNYKRQELAQELLPDGISNTSKIQFSNGNLEINNCKFMINGLVINVQDPIKISISNNDVVYLEVINAEKTHQDNLKKFGNNQSTKTTANSMLDGRVNFETSRRVQTTFNLTKQQINPVAKYLEIGKLINGVFNISVLNYNNSFKFQDKGGKEYICFRQLSRDGKPQIIYKEVI